MQIIGIDCSTNLRNVGLARAQVISERASVEKVECGSSDLARNVAEWIGSTRTLLCLDAPLGWPAAFERLASHAAGDEVGTARETTFNRETDRVVASLIKQTPLRVGADRIAMTAHWALEMLGKLRRSTGLRIPLAWAPDYEDQVAVIEVYPAATLKSYRIRCSGYKKGEQGDWRAEIVDELRRVIDLNGVRSEIIGNADLLDASACCLAGFDFLMGRAIPAPTTDTVRKEGWIWVSRPTL